MPILPHGSEETYFAPAGRAHPSRLQSQVAACLESPVAKAVLESLAGYVMILNQQRQILAINEELELALTAKGGPAPTGRRWGEVMDCVHAPEGPDGCGTSHACSCCGAALGILASRLQDGKAATECRMAMRQAGVWEGREFHVTANMVALDAGRFQVVVFQDVSDQRRRESMEKMFLHDLANTVLALDGWTSVLDKGVDESVAAGKILTIARRLSDFVNDQRLLLRAESGDLEAFAKEMDAGDLVESVAGILRSHPTSRGREVVIGQIPAMTVVVDPALLIRVLLNMGLNALEAVAAGKQIRLDFGLVEGKAVFSVWNPGAMPADVALQVFHRSFSTKAKSGRGLGTHSMKILGENYIKGKVGFRSTPEEGTTFFIELPENS
ncbi:MAG: HAMP domain-containing histidine kinase [Fibrobacteres bacterium]|jgi:signal transduction histidine kinase|nr:HAMP domain-containing histidine kinase [Fibrobacterota bacterium]